MTVGDSTKGWVAMLDCYTPSYLLLVGMGPIVCWMSFNGFASYALLGWCTIKC